MGLLLTILGILPFALLGVFVFWVIAGVITMNSPSNDVPSQAQPNTKPTRRAPIEHEQVRVPLVDDFDYGVNHLPVNEVIVRSVLGNPNVTYEDCDALYFSLCNHPNYGGTHPLIDDVLRKQGEVYKKR